MRLGNDICVGCMPARIHVCTFLVYMYACTYVIRRTHLQTYMYVYSCFGACRYTTRLVKLQAYEFLLSVGRKELLLQPRNWINFTMIATNRWPDNRILALLIANRNVYQVPDSHCYCLLVTYFRNTLSHGHVSGLPVWTPKYRPVELAVARAWTL